jgi:hypothetical protein
MYSFLMSELDEDDQEDEEAMSIIYSQFMNEQNRIEMIKR